MKTFKTIFLSLAVIFSFTACEFNSPTEGFKVEGSIYSLKDYPSNEVMAFLSGVNFKFGTKISESKLENNYFSLFLPYELKDRYCDAIATKTQILYDDEFESYLTISNKNVKIAQVWFSSDKEYYFGGNVTQFGYREYFSEDFYNDHIVKVTLVKTKYVYAQLAVSITGEYETRLTSVHGEDLYKRVKMNLFLQKGWNIIYHIGTFTSKPYTYLWEVDTAILNITAEKPEHIELKWYYDFWYDHYKILKNEGAQFIDMPFMSSYYEDLYFNRF